MASYTGAHMASDDPKTLVSTEWLAAHLKDPDLRILDATYFLPGSDRDARAEYEAAHIPGARFFDIDDVLMRVPTCRIWHPRPKSSCHASGRWAWVTGIRWLFMTPLA